MSSPRSTKTDPERWARASALFDAWCDLDRVAQRKHLDALRAEDADLAREVAELLAADASEDDLFDRGLAAQGEVVQESLAAQGLAPRRAAGRKPDTIVGPYRLIDCVGRGGMGEVWRAALTADPNAPPVALKLLRPGMDSEDLVRRFALERRILERLDHPGIARLLDAGTASDGQPWIAVEFIEGIAIDRYAREHGFDVTRRVELIAELCSAVDFAHRRLIVHRDLKPSNILIDAQGRASLLDFGIAKLLAEEPGADRLTQTGMRAFSPAYAAPEQILGEPVTTATDVYALGLVLFELLTGQLPHNTRRKTGAPAGRDVEREVVEAPSAVLRRAPGNQVEAAYGTAANERERHVRRIAGDLDTIVLSALRREPERRYASATALADDLRRYLEGMPISARRESWRYRARKFVGRHRVALTVTALLAGVLFAGVAATFWQARIAEREARRADAEARTARDSAARASATRDALVAMFRASGPDSIGNPTLSLGEVLEEGRRRVESEGEEDALTRADLAEALARVHLAAGMNDDALRLATLAVDLREKQTEPDSRALAMARVTLGRALAVAGQRDRAQDLLATSAASLRDTGGLPTARMALELATPLILLDRYDQAREVLGIAERAATNRRGGEALRIEAIARQGELARDAGDYDTAIRELRRALALAQPEGSDPNAEALALEARLADALADSGAPAEALTHYEHVLGTSRDLFAGTSSLALDVLPKAGAAALQLGQGARLRRALDDLTEFAAQGSAAEARARLLEAESLRARGEANAALVAYTQAIALLNANLGGDHPLVWWGRLRQSLARADAQGVNAEALTEFDVARERLAAAYGQRHQLVRQADLDRALLGCRAGQIDDGLARLTRVRERLDVKDDTRAHPELTRLALARAECALRAPSFDAARVNAELDAADKTLPAGLRDTALEARLIALRARSAQREGRREEARVLADSAAARFERLDARGLAPVFEAK